MPPSSKKPRYPPPFFLFRFWILTCYFFIHFLSLNAAVVLFLLGLFSPGGVYLPCLLIFTPPLVVFFYPRVPPLDVVRYRYCNLFCQHVNTV